MVPGPVPTTEELPVEAVTVDPAVARGRNLLWWWWWGEFRRNADARLQGTDSWALLCNH